LDSGQNYGFENETGEGRKERRRTARIKKKRKKNAREGPSRFDGH